MTTIQVNERTKAGKLILQTARMLAKDNKGIVITSEDEEDRVLMAKMETNRTGELLNDNEQADFMETLRKIAEQ